jgi:hypothetical protein
MWRSRTANVVLDKECIAHGHKFLCKIDQGTDGHSGAVLNEHGAIRWRYGTRKNPSVRSLGNPFSKPDFVIADSDGRDEVVIRRASFVPPVFDIMETGGIIGRVRMCSLFRNKYAIDIDQVDSWTFRMPLFSIRFFGDSSTGRDIWVAAGHSKMEWLVLVKRGTSEWPLLATVAFIHVEAWNYG